ncbi:M48 family metallopeptidase [Endomicrobium proavitum]|uniref:Protease HtpX homolog n=1 Tax=Endomicrobium proavitum TaxID=1408281 RepID=A0A0G3WL95_9BACT|nr:M48 family metallopeptidase [Endomicrobium proavitum]AKL98279.1 M48 family peptidase [Endomicrobium proavitum]
MPKITTYDFIDSNTRKTALLMVLFPISLAALIYIALLILGAAHSADTTANAAKLSPVMFANEIAIYAIPVISAAAILWVIISYFFGQNFILSAAGAVELTKNNSPEVIRIVENIALTSGLPMPKVYAINDEGLNAFATGRDPKHSYIALTKGIINKLDKPELEGVIAHEMAHIGNRDIKLMLITVVCISFATIAAEILLRVALSKGRSSSKNKGQAQLLFLALALVFYIYGYFVAPLIKLALSRTREYQADATAALITRNPQGLASALRKISENSTVEKLKDKETVAAMCIETPLSKEKQNSLFSKISGLYSTHPPIEKRIKALMEMDGQRT